VPLEPPLAIGLELVWSDRVELETPPHVLAKKSLDLLSRLQDPKIPVVVVAIDPSVVDRKLTFQRAPGRNDCACLEMIHSGDIAILSHSVNRLHMRQKDNKS